MQCTQYPSDAAVPTLQPTGPLVDGDQIREDVAGRGKGRSFSADIVVREVGQKSLICVI